MQETFRPYLVKSQHLHSPKLFEKFYRQAHELYKYHSDPHAFLIGHLMTYALRYNEGSEFYKTLHDIELSLNLSRPYVG